MRIIAGEWRGRRLESPEGRDIRPTSDKVKEAIFNLLMYDIEGASCLDLFSGTGSLGLEALSRGAASCIFCDNSRDSMALTKRNIARCGAGERSVTVCGDYMKALRRSRERLRLIFIDPPYDSGLYRKCLAAIDELDLLTDDGIIIAEHDRRTELPSREGSLVRFRQRRYGRTLVSLYTADTEDNND